MADRFRLVPGERLADKQHQFDVITDDAAGKMVGVLYWTGDGTTCWGLALPVEEYKQYRTWRNVIAIPEADEPDDALIAFTAAVGRLRHYLTEEVDT
jgi:putative intracellular protease/amidase